MKIRIKLVETPVKMRSILACCIIDKVGRFDLDTCGATLSFECEEFVQCLEVFYSAFAELSRGSGIYAILRMKYKVYVEMPNGHRSIVGIWLSRNAKGLSYGYISRA